MLATPKLADLLALADRQRWRLVLVGDPLQLSAVGRGGMFAFLTATQPTVSLETVHRFARPWERHASLALRTGAPGALDAYERRGRLHDGPPALVEDAVVDHWRDVRTTGITAVLCATNRTARRLNARLQAERHAAGELTGTGLRLPSGDVLYVGDVIATRRNNRTLRTDQGAMVKNRARWTIAAINQDRSVTLAGRDGRITLPAAYVTDHVELAYAETIHAAQGRTVDHALLLADGPIDGHALYVAMTRGRHTNHAYVATHHGERARDLLEDALGRSWIDRPAIEIELEHTRQGLIDRLDAVGRRPAHEPPGLGWGL